LDLLYACFSDSVYVVFTLFSATAPPLIGVAPVKVVRIHGVLEFSGKIPRTSRRWMSNVSGTIVPNFLLVENFLCLVFCWGPSPRFKDLKENPRIVSP
jgi:hypothetical protein